jgi:AmmeMemoRadiSam system protein B
MDTVKRGDYFAAQGWYPAQDEACDWQIQKFLDAAEKLDLPPDRLRCGIVPHAGWMFSGELATWTIGALARHADQVETVVVLGGHLGPGSGSWILKDGRWPTPVGDLEVDRDLAEAVARETGWRLTGPADYQPDNTLELQMPILRYCFGNSRIVAAGVAADPDCHDAGAAVVRAAATLGRDIVVIGSTDLTHYGPNYGFNPAGAGEEAVAWVKEVNDARGVELMVNLDPETLVGEALEKHFCCCPGSTAATLAAARALGAEKGHVLSTLTSYDVHPGESFVGYAAVVF